MDTNKRLDIIAKLTVLREVLKHWPPMPTPADYGPYYYPEISAVRPYIDGYVTAWSRCRNVVEFEIAKLELELSR